MPICLIEFAHRTVCLAVIFGLLVCGASAQDADAQSKPKTGESAAKKSLDRADKLIPLNKQKSVLLDVAGKRVLLKTKVVLREGILEMLVCKKQTKEHESILSVDAQAYEIHAGLAKLGAEAGTPVVLYPKFKAATGQPIDIFLQWRDTKGKLHREPAQTWMRYVTRRFYGEKLEQLPAGLVLPNESELKYDKKFKELSWFGQMSKAERDKYLKLSNDKAFQAAIHSFYKQSQTRQFDMTWVFAGSSFTVEEKTGQRFYNAEGGEVVCVANFPTSMIDVTGKSSSMGEANLLFEPWKERVPPVDTEVTVELVPVFKKAKK